MTSVEIVKALRYIATVQTGDEPCESCPFNRTETLTEEQKAQLHCEEWHSCDVDGIALAAAELIERLEKEKADAQWIPVMRLIDANELESLFNEQIARGATDLLAAFDDALQGIPTVDAIEVVHCKDCEYWGDEFGRMHAPDGRLCDRCKAHSYLVGGRYIGLFSKENDFCSSGKRRSE